MTLSETWQELEKNTVIEISRYPAERETLSYQCLEKHKGYLMVIDEDGQPLHHEVEPDVVIIAEDIHRREMIYNTRTGVVQLLTDYSKARFVPCEINLRVVARRRFIDFPDAGYITHTEGAARKRVYRRPTGIVPVLTTWTLATTRTSDVLS
ncbi:hypothetical protein [Stenotrophomonas phage CM2]